jgi:hypothetical protein
LIPHDRGEITAIEPSSREDGGAIIGYSSGMVLSCNSSQDCRDFDGTPSVSVEQIAVSKHGESQIIWITYRQGALYHCVNSSCNKLAR